MAPTMAVGTAGAQPPQATPAGSGYGRVPQGYGITQPSAAGAPSQGTSTQGAAPQGYGMTAAQSQQSPLPQDPSQADQQVALSPSAQIHSPPSMQSAAQPMGQRPAMPPGVRAGIGMPSGHALGHGQVATTAYGAPMYVPPAQPKKRRGLKVLAVVLPIVLLMSGGGVAAWYFWSARDVYSSSQVIALSNSWSKGADQAWSADVPANLEPYVVGDHFLTFNRTDATLTGHTPLGRDMKKAWQITLNDENLTTNNASVPSFQTWGDNTIVYKSTLIDVRSGNTSPAPWGDGNSELIASDITIFCNSSDKCTAWDANQKQKWSRDIPGTGEASTFTFLRNELTLTRDGRRYICLYNIVINIDSGETLILGRGSRADTDLRTMYFKDGWGTYKEDKKDSTPDSESSSATRLEVTTYNVKGNKQDNYIETLSRETRVVLDENELLTAKEYRTYFKGQGLQQGRTDIINQRKRMPHQAHSEKGQVHRCASARRWRRLGRWLRFFPLPVRRNDFSGRRRRQADDVEARRHQRVTDAYERQDRQGNHVQWDRLEER